MSVSELLRPSGSTSLSGHQSARMKSEVWLTPPEILQALGTFDLDPCAPAMRPWDMARDHISPPADGLAADWWGRVWLNPPFGTKAAAWLRKMNEHGKDSKLTDHGRELISQP